MKLLSVAAFIIFIILLSARTFGQATLAWWQICLPLFIIVGLFVLREIGRYFTTKSRDKRSTKMSRMKHQKGDHYS
jgi:small neutral amino acid transporter SnatA (MarC family)